MKRPCLPLPAVQAPTTKILPTKCLNTAEPQIFCPPKITRYAVYNYCFTEHTIHNLHRESFGLYHLLLKSLKMVEKPFELFNGCLQCGQQVFLRSVCLSMQLLQNSFPQPPCCCGSLTTSRQMRHLREFAGSSTNL